MSITREFKNGDLLYGLREDVQLYIIKFSIQRPELFVLTQSHINKYLTVGLLDKHAAFMKKPDGAKASLAATLVKKAGSTMSYGSFSSVSTKTPDPALERALAFCNFLSTNYNKYPLTEPIGQCHFFKRLCKQSILASKGKNNIHFILDSLYNSLENLYHIFKKTQRYKCEECNHDSVTASELRFIYRNRKLLKDTVKFWYNGKEVSPPWETFPEIHDLYPGRKQKESIAKFILCDPKCECCIDPYHFKIDDILVDAKGNIAAMLCPRTQNILHYNPFAYECMNDSISKISIA